MSVTETAPVLSRRAWLAASGATLTVMFSGCALPVIPKRPAPTTEGAAGWIRHDGDGRFTLWLPRAEMGQQVTASLRQIACEELGVEWDAVTPRRPSTLEGPRVRATVGSESIQAFALPLARACATLREAWRAGRRGQLQAVEWPEAELRAFRRGGRHVGARVPLAEGREIVTGAPLYAADQRPDGLLHGRVLRAPVAPDWPTRLLGVDEAAARAVPGFVALVRDDRLRHFGADAIGLVCRTPAALERAAAALAPQWQVDADPAHPAHAALAAPLDIDRRLAAGRRPAHTVHDDRIDSEAPWDVDLRIDIDAAPHHAIEPRAAVAVFGGGGLTVWAGTQDAFYVADVLAKRLALDAERVRVQPCRIGGAFGGRTIATVELEAALLARAVDAPVKVQWTRAMELQQAFHRPPASHRLRARLAPDGSLRDWWHGQASGHVLFTSAAMPPWLQTLASVVGDGGVARGMALPYRAGRRFAGFDHERLPVPSGPWRGLGAGPNGLAMESAIDLCARRAGADPLDWRRRHASEPRLVRVLDAVARASAWQAAAPSRGASPRRGRGVACGTYKERAHTAVVAEVAVADDGAVRVTRLVCALDAGFLVNPDAVLAQCEGNLVWGLSMVLHDRLPYAEGRVTARNFAEAPLPRIGELPPLEVVLVDEGDAPGGAGETAIVAAAAAIANALADATGVRATRFPVDPAAFAR